MYYDQFTWVEKKSKTIVWLMLSTAGLSVSETSNAGSGCCVGLINAEIYKVKFYESTDSWWCVSTSLLQAPAVVHLSQHWQYIISTCLAHRSFCPTLKNRGSDSI